MVALKSDQGQVIGAHLTPATNSSLVQAQRIASDMTTISLLIILEIKSAYVTRKMATTVSSVQHVFQALSPRSALDVRYAKVVSSGESSS